MNNIVLNLAVHNLTVGIMFFAISSLELYEFLNEKMKWFFIISIEITTTQWGVWLVFLHSVLKYSGLPFFPKGFIFERWTHYIQLYLPIIGCCSATHTETHAWTLAQPSLKTPMPVPYGRVFAPEFFWHGLRPYDFVNLVILS